MALAPSESGAKVPTLVQELRKRLPEVAVFLQGPRPLAFIILPMHHDMLRIAMVSVTVSVRDGLCPGPWALQDSICLINDPSIVDGNMYGPRMKKSNDGPSKFRTRRRVKVAAEHGGDSKPSAMVTNVDCLCHAALLLAAIVNTAISEDHTKC